MKEKGDDEETISLLASLGVATLAFLEGEGELPFTATG
jgi:hypothetical protein